MLWVAGAFVEGGARLLLWGLAVAGSYVGGWVGHWLPGRGRRVELEHTEIAAVHLVERFRLFFIIVLGETVMMTGAAFVGEPFAPVRLLALAIGLSGTIALWWCYFERAEALGAGAAEDAGAVALWGTWTLTLIVLGLISIAVADELVVAHPGDDATLGFMVLAFGGPALFLLAQILFQHAALGRGPRLRWVGLAALAILAVATARLTLIFGIAASSAVLIAVAITDTLRAGASATSEPA